MKKYISAVVTMMFVASLTLAGGGMGSLREADTMVYPAIKNGKEDHYGKHTAPPPGKPDKRKWQGTKTKK